MKKKLHIFLSISLVLVLVIFFHYIGILLPLENFLRSVFTPATQNMYNISVDLSDGKNVNFSSEKALKEAYKDLAEQMSTFEVLRAREQMLSEENLELKSQLQFFSSQSYEHVGAGVIGKNTDPVSHALILSVGANKNVQIGDAVIVGEGILIGKISQVFQNNSIVRLLNDNKSKVAATVLNNEKSLGVVEGGYGISVHMNLIPQNENVNIDDTVITSGLEKNIPRGILIGKVESTEKEPYKPFQKAVLRPLIDLDTIQVVSIITHFNNENESEDFQDIPAL